MSLLATMSDHRQHADAPAQHAASDRRWGPDRRMPDNPETLAYATRERPDRRRYDRRVGPRRAGENARLFAETLNQLHDARAELARQEKLASLGRLVAGMTHEINTPLGICVTAISHLQSELRHWHAWNRSGHFNASRLNAMLHELDQTVRILDINARRGAELVRSFKQVAVDQSADQRRTFDLADYLDEIVLSLKPRLRDAACTVPVDCPRGILMDSIPGALSQVMINLIMNALLHGFEGGKGGSVGIHVEVDGDDVVLQVADDGIGMDETDLARLFDPYFTTKHGRGGSGLGAHIVYTQVTEVLRGTIEVRSSPGSGLRVQMRLPRTLERARLSVPVS